MDIKKYSLKTMCTVLACTAFLNSMLAASATDAVISESPMSDSAETGLSDSRWITEESSFDEIEVTYQQSSSYFVTIPKAITLDAKKQGVYSVKVTGDIDAKQRVYVAPVDGIIETQNLDFYMKEKNNKKDDVAATVTQNKAYWNSEEVADGYEETNNSISAPDLTAGTWSGTFQMDIRLETDNSHVHHFVDGVCEGCGETHTHSYVDWKCECGETDPNHTHNYEDGKCTICGKETDPYETAPENEFKNWQYVLDNENDIITLQQYTNTTATDAIVYANYIVDGKTYKTQLASHEYNMSRNYMFCDKENIKTIIFSHDLDTSNVKNMDYMFSGCKALEQLDISGFDTSNVTSMDSMFWECSSLADLDISSFDTKNVTDMGLMFYKCQSLVNLDLGSLNTTNVTSMYGLFMDCSSLANINFGDNFDTGNVTNMNYMFGGCGALEELDVSGFDTSSVTDMSQMFNGCNSLTSLDISNFDTSNVTNMYSMFAYVRGVTTLDLSNFNTSKVKKMNDMFRSCSGLTELDLTSFDTSNVTDMSYMFIDCTSLTSLDLSSFNTSKVTKMNSMFMRDSSLKTIYAALYKWSTSQATITNMFANCGTSSVTYK